MQVIFLAAVERHRPEDWDAYLDQACAGDEELRRQVSRLLRAHREAGSVPGAATSEHGDTATDQPAAEAAGGVIGPYQLLEGIGEGGMGTVYLAQQTAPVKRLVALKVIKPGMDSKQVLARFDAERQALNLIFCYEKMRRPAGAEPFLRELATYWKQKAGADSRGPGPELRRRPRPSRRRRPRGRHPGEGHGRPDQRHPERQHGPGRRRL
jgi:hypothetical protein